MSEEPEENYSNIRDLLGWAIGRKIVDISQHDKEEWDENGESYVMLLLDDGNFIKFPVGDEAFSYSEDSEKG